MEFLSHHDAARRRENVGALRGREIQPGVQRRTAGDGVDAPAKPRADHIARHRFLRGNHVFGQVLIHEARLHHRHQIHSLAAQLLQIIERALQVFQAERPACHQHPAPARRCTGLAAAVARQRNTCQTRNTVTQRFKLHHACLHLPHLAGHRVDVLAQEALALCRVVPRHQAHQIADHGPAFARSFEENQVVQARGHAHQEQGQAQRGKQQARPGERNGPASRKTRVHDN